MAEIKPCPFCGGKSTLEDTGQGWTVGCEEAESSVHYCMGYQSITEFATQHEAINAWNTRATPGIDVDTITRFEVSDFRMPKSLDTKRGKLLNISDCKITIETLDGALRIYIQDGSKP